MNAAASSVCVVIAAWNAENTIARAVASALAQPEVSEVVVVDDASTDNTVAAALRACDGSGRLRVIEQVDNRGPSAARNRAIAESNAPFLAILDSDDFLIAGRFATLFAFENWDAIVDDIAFIAESNSAKFKANDVRCVSPSPRCLTFSAFIQGNISQRDKPRAELGFIKPVIRRAFLDAQDLVYDETLRLGEDYALYARMLARGARFIQIFTCGYVAIERALSLSGSHRTADLRALLQSDSELLGSFGLSRNEREIVTQHANQIALKLLLRGFLDTKRSDGLLKAIGNNLSPPMAIPKIARAVFDDKLAQLRPGGPPSEGVRYLFS
jgi:succinoglycan biosynthesis protein ExoU